AGLRGDDDPDVLDARLRHRLDAVEEHGAVGHRHELLGARVRDRAQARAAPAGEDEALEAVHQYTPPSLRWSQVTRARSANSRPTRLGACLATIARMSSPISPPV